MLTVRKLGVATGISAFIVYLLTAYPNVPGGDAGELIGAVATNGVPHPSGYPLFVLLTKPFTWLPLFSVAWRANVASAALAAIAVAFVAWSVTALTGRRWAGVAAAAVFAFSPTVWLYAVSAEVFSLNNLLIAIELALLILIDRAARASAPDRQHIERLLMAGALVFGLGLSNHSTSLFFNGVFLAAMVLRTSDDAAWRSARRWLTLAGCAAAGLLPYLYLPIAASQHPLIVWGEPNTFSGLMTHMLRREYGTFQLNQNLTTTAKPLIEQLGFYGRDLIHQVTWLGIALAAWGVAKFGADAKTRFLAVATLTAWALYLVVLHSLATFPLDQPLFHGVVARFWQAPNLLVCLWIGWGVASLRVPEKALGSVAIALAIGQVALNASASNHRSDTMVHDYGNSILQNVPPNSLVLLRGDVITNTTRYLHDVEHVRPDVRLLDQEMLTFRWMTPQVKRQMPDVVLPGTHYDMTMPGSYSLRALIDANIGGRPVVICGGAKTGDSSLSGVYRSVPLGFCDRVFPVSEPIDIPAWLASADAAAPHFSNDMRRIPDADSWEFVVWTDYWETAHRVALMCLNLAIERHDDPALLRRAADGLDQLVATHPQPPAYAYKNLGIARARLMPVDPASGAGAIAAWTTYLRVGPAGDKDRAAIETALKQMTGK